MTSIEKLTYDDAIQDAAELMEKIGEHEWADDIRALKKTAPQTVTNHAPGTGKAGTHPVGAAQYVEDTTRQIEEWRHFLNRQHIHSCDGMWANTLCDLARGGLKEQREALAATRERK